MSELDSPAGLAVVMDEITVCICTYRRPELLEKLLNAVAAQRTESQFSFSCVVIDNDTSQSALPLIERLRKTFPVALQYAVEPARNFALVRNRGLSLVSGNLFAFIDDDEVPNEDWLFQLWQVMGRTNADAVLGPVRPYFETKPPKWIERGKICDRPVHPTGSRLRWGQTRTGNVLVRTSMVREGGIQFDPAFSTGGEDVDFFRRASKAGKTFVWCEEAPAYELVPQSRLTRSYHLKRAFLQGRVSLKYATESKSMVAMAGVAAKAAVAASIYTVALPFLFLVGDHLGMKYLIKDCHHLGRLLAVFGVSHSTRRDF